MRIAADGTWFYLKTPIGRPCRWYKLFASVLKREGGQVLPRSRRSRNAASSSTTRRSCAVELQGRGTGDLARACTSAPMSTTGSPAGPSTPLRFEPEPDTGGLKPYLHVRPRSVGEGDAGAVL